MASTLALALTACLPLPQEAAAPPLRVRLFDRMEVARFEGAAPKLATACDPERTLALGFEPASRPTAWLGRRDGRNVKWESDPWKLATLTADGGVHGGGSGPDCRRTRATSRCSCRRVRCAATGCAGASASPTTPPPTRPPRARSRVSSS
jgi:hypothetical protein